MKYYSTNRRCEMASAREAVLSGLAPDGGLYMPQAIPRLAPGFVSSLAGRSFAETSAEIAFPFLNADVPRADLDKIVSESMTFSAPLVTFSSELAVLELFHGPTLAFKDFGARFMARLMSYFQRGEDRELTILVATSGDTGSAVASGFFAVPGIRVIVLYPSGQVSLFQEKQLTTLGGNVTAIEVQGVFDDCQRLVKEAFVDAKLRTKLRLSSANSINIARLIPQSFYYFSAYAQLSPDFPSPVFSVPSGNFGNLTAGLIAKRMGLPIRQFIAATNANDVVVDYLKTGQFCPRPSVSTLSNAMDVGNPSNFARMLELYEHDIDKMRTDLCGAGFSDAQTRDAIKEVFEKYGYVLDPHGAVGYLGLKAYARGAALNYGIFLETAHPAKFGEIVEDVLGQRVAIPDRTAEVLRKEKQAVHLSHHFAEFKEFLLSRS